MFPMDKFIRAYFDKSLRPNRSQHLVVSDSKRLFYRLSDERVGYQKKALDPRTCGPRKMLTRVIAADEDTGLIYAELWPRDEALDLVGFLARAWATKDRNPMRGYPEVLNVPAAVSDDPDLADQVQYMARLSGARLAPTRSGFGPAAVAAREYERALLSAGAGTERFVLLGAQMAAAAISALASASSLAVFGGAWDEVQAMNESAIAEVDRLYDPVGAWRTDPFSFVSVVPPQ